MSQFVHEPDERAWSGADFVAKCAIHLSTVACTIEDALFVAALDISSADVLYSVNRCLDSDPAMLSRAASRLVRWHRISETTPQFKGSLPELLYVTTGSFHLLRPLNEKLSLALYLAVRGKPTRIELARAALRRAAHALEARSPEITST